MGCDPTKRTAALKGIRAELDRIAQKSISPVELKRAKEFILGRHHMDMQLNGAIASASAFNTLYGIGFDEHLKIAERLKNIDVKAVKNLAERIFGSPSVTAIVV